MMRKLIGAFVELMICQLLFLKDDGHGIRRPRHLFLEQLVNTLLAGIVNRRVVPLHQ